jgi:hypothetical protein
MDVLIMVIAPPGALKALAKLGDGRHVAKPQI